MKLQLLPSTFEEQREVSPKQHLACFVIDNRVAIDAGSLAMSATQTQKNNIRDVVLTHAHLDHIAGLPLFIDDLFSNLEEPVCVYATAEVIEILERDIFNWAVYPRFSELKNDNGTVLKYVEFKTGKQFNVRHLHIKSVEVNHKVPAVGFIICDGKTKFAITGDTSKAGTFWEAVNKEKNLDALLIECAFPDKMEELADASHHLTPKLLESELANLHHKNCPIYVINLKPMYREQIVKEIENLNITNLNILEVGKIYDF